MKKIIALGFFAAVLFSSCSTTKAVREQRKTINGDWVLNHVSFANQEGSFKSVLFNDAQDICFEGSTWNFINNNSTGTYTINPSSLCSSGTRYIRWSVIENEMGKDQLQFKFIDEKKKDVSNGYGYRLDINNITPTTMELASQVITDGAPVSVIYEFVKQ
ncbi:lipocalin family protein [Cellulophaga baltica]|uniref:lipocalin family protein n=1 Tax=Cellulophaga TaxID=104264 RepID=UPI001C073E0B|nr:MULTISPECIES: lipocalin family protein [Cellulophaga]MBU2996360.1 lipocalin family protein [Cellulophaga baltica]MDO6767756.1 lipocalin family protein [Cellulophaga sp. 1_MG-2023]